MGEGETMRTKTLLVLALATFVAAIVAGMGANAAFAGEVTGNCNHADPGTTANDNCKGPDPAVSNGNSWCRYSGQNDKPDSTDPADPGGNTQNWGQLVKSGAVEPSQIKGGSPSPGTECNPNGDHNAVPDGPPPRK